ncbi:MAG: FkbM family methyltransferase [Fulvimarina manganoxydans]|uniref:FkbM family methyltransferase n=1 Tax=Fulvimarina manganoxydans TaxID=937218 RepID=UPI0023577488|nr:FkbM family methyltransferase [Fulvimarina manganoxydans]MCK5931151.1 FkbM family methyltransferase [Fulvimarina manganoxydans]
MREAIARQIRGAQVRAPWLFGLKNAVQRGVRRRLKRPFEQDFEALRALGLNPSGLILDIGGNRGQSIDAVRLTLPRAPIISFEPNPQLADDLKDLFKADANVEIRQRALGDRPGEFTLFIPYYNGWMFDGLASLDRAEAESWLSADNLAGFDPQKVTIREVTCQVSTLDAECPGLSPVFVKIDVQGFEPNVLDGGRALLERARPVVMLESRHDVDMLAHLPAGYEAAHYDGTTLKLGDRQTMNTFYLPAEIARRF